MDVIKNIVKAIGLLIALFIQFIVIAAIGLGITFGLAAIIIFLLPEYVAKFVCIALIAAMFIYAFISAYKYVADM